MEMSAVVDFVQEAFRMDSDEEVTENRERHRQVRESEKVVHIFGVFSSVN